MRLFSFQLLAAFCSALKSTAVTGWQDVYGGEFKSVRCGGKTSAEECYSTGSIALLRRRFATASQTFELPVLDVLGWQDVYDREFKSVRRSGKTSAEECYSTGSIALLRRRFATASQTFELPFLDLLPPRGFCYLSVFIGGGLTPSQWHVTLASWA